MKTAHTSKFLKRLLPALALAACCSQAALAQVGVNVIIGSPPPPPRVESVPVPVQGRVWVPGYWGWDGYRHVWVQGHWEVARPGYVYQQPVWVETPRGWRLVEGGWRPHPHEYHRPHPHGCPPGQAKKGWC